MSSEDDIPASVVENKDFRQALTCPVCLDFYKQPRHFSSCPHSLCGECMASLVENSLLNEEGSDSTIVCPICRQETWIDEEKGLNGFHVNIELKRLVELFIEHSHQVGKEEKQQKLDEIAYNNRDPQRQTEFFEACLIGDIIKVRQMLEQAKHELLIESRYHRQKHGSIRQHTWYMNNTCLHIASWGGQDEVVGLVLKTYLEHHKKDCVDRGALLSRFVNEQGVSSGLTALHCAAYKGEAKCIDQLCSDDLRGITDVEIRTLDGFAHSGFTALMLAVNGGHSEAVVALVKYGAQVNARHVKTGQTALGLAKQLQASPGICDILANAGAIE